MTRTWPRPTYTVTAEFRAPLEFVYRWCTDYTPEDASYESEAYRRRILERSSRRVVYEDLEETKEGWLWARHVVRLMPPARWHSDSVGSHREISLDYRLTRLPGGRTRLTLTAHRSPSGVGRKNPAKTAWERSVAQTWKRFGRFLERDFRRAGGAKPARAH